MIAERLGVGIIGCGSISVNHLKALQQTENVYIAAVCDIDPAKCREAAKQYGATPYEDYHDLLADERVRSVHICTPHYLHAPIAIDALNTGHHVLTEKPMAISLDQANAMLAAEAASGKVLGVCFQNRYNAATRFIEQAIQNDLGPVKGGAAIVMWDRGARYYASGDWRGKWATEGGALMINQAIHTLDLLRHFAGEEIVDIKSSMSAKRNASCIECEDTCDLLMTTASGNRFLFYASNCCSGNWPIQLRLTCAHGEIELNGNIVTLRREGQPPVTEDFTDHVTYGKDYWGKGHILLIQDFYRCLRSGDPFPINATEALKTTLLLEKAYTDHVNDCVRPG